MSKPTSNSPWVIQYKVFTDKDEADKAALGLARVRFIVQVFDITNAPSYTVEA